MAQINKPSDYFNTVLYTGNGSTNNITGLNFAPDFVWLKSRTQGSTGYNGNHFFFDNVRGVQKYLRSDLTNAEGTLSTSLTSFDSDGFTIGTLDNINNSGDAFVSWNWLASNATAVSNTDGSITSTVSVNTTSGFSIVSYTGTGSAGTIGHGLGVAPKMIIVKDRDDAASWQVYHASLGATKYLKLDATDAEATNTNRWNDAEPTSSVFTVGTASGTNGYVGSNYIAYCFAEKKGYSKFGSYAPNGSADGNFIYLGFSPAFFLVKNTNTTRNWLIFDNKRNTSNEITKSLEPNTSDAEQTDANLKVDFLSNGVKLRGLGGDLNTADGVQYIYMAFAEQPLVGTNNIPATAR